MERRSKGKDKEDGRGGGENEERIQFRRGS